MRSTGAGPLPGPPPAGREGRRLVFVQGAQLNADAATALAAWVKEGGTLYLGAGSAQFDQYNQPMDFDGQLGIKRGAFTLAQPPEQQEVNYYATRRLCISAASVHHSKVDCVRQNPYRVVSIREGLL